MSTKKPDNVVYADGQGYHASVLPYATNVGAPAIQLDDVVSWKNRGIASVNNQLAAKFNELKQQYDELLREYECNELVYNAKFSFEPIPGETYHMYRHRDGHNFLSLISPLEWNREHLGTFKLTSDKTWIEVNIQQQ
jgi:hypothetical protein